MTVAKALKALFKALTGTEPSGMTVSDVVRNGTGNVPNAAVLNMKAVKYEDTANKSFVLNSSTELSTKKFRITVVDDGTLSATEITEG